MSANFMGEPTDKLTYKLLKQTYKPQFVNINVEFGDSEVFLVDGDALLLHLLNLNKNVSCSSLHLIFLMEVFLHQFIKRSGKFSLIFFSDNEGNWSSTTNFSKLLLLRTAVVYHFQNATDIDVLTKYESPFDEDFTNHVQENKPTFILSSFEQKEERKITRKTLTFLQFQSLGINFAEIEEMSMDVATISAWFCTSSTLPPDIQKHLLHQHLKLEIIKQTVKFESG